MRNQFNARYLGMVFSTSECGVALRDDEGNEGYAAVPMDARASLCGWPSHYLQHSPFMLATALERLRSEGWSFPPGGYVCQSWRQHDLAVIGADDVPLIPAPSWECAGAVTEARLLSDMPGFVAAVGRVEPRFLVAKLPWILEQIPSLLPAVRRVTLSGDWINGMLTGVWRLGASDALCNGLLNQRTKTLATDELRQAGALFDGRLRPEWFPTVVETAGVVGEIRPSIEPVWGPICNLLQGWRAVAPLGDNQATAAGCGTTDYRTIVISLGSSGTVNRVCPPGAPLRGAAASFDYWDNRLLLLILSQCGSWYEAFRRSYEPACDYVRLNEMAGSVDPAKIIQLQPPEPASLGGAEAWRSVQLDGLGRAERVASIQVSIALAMLELVDRMLMEVEHPGYAVDRFVLTGGLSRAPLIRDVLSVGLWRLRPGTHIFINARPGALAHKTDALGAILNAMIAESGATAPEIIAANSGLEAHFASSPVADQVLERFVRHPKRFTT